MKRLSFDSTVDKVRRKFAQLGIYIQFTVKEGGPGEEVYVFAEFPNKYHLARMYPAHQVLAMQKYLDIPRKQEKDLLYEDLVNWVCTGIRGYMHAE